MYYESREHKRVDVADAEAAVNFIESNECSGLHAVFWKTPDGQEMCAVDDGCLDDLGRWSEVAVFKCFGKERFQVDSITFAWCDREQRLHHMKVCEGLEIGRAATLSIDGDGRDKLAGFECGCCGEWFNSTITKQKKYDQDAGYGICPACSRYYPVGE